MPRLRQSLFNNHYGSLFQNDFCQAKKRDTVTMGHTLTTFSVAYQLSLNILGDTCISHLLEGYGGNSCTYLTAGTFVVSSFFSFFKLTSSLSV